MPVARAPMGRVGAVFSPRESSSYPGLRGMAWVRWFGLTVAALICLVGTEGHVYAIPAFYAPIGDSVLSIPTIAAAVFSLCAILMQNPLRGVSRGEAWFWGLAVLTAVATQILHARGVYPGSGEMAVGTAISFVLLSVGQLCYGRLHMAAYGLCLMAMMLPFLALCGYLFGEPVFFGAMSLSTSLLFLAMGTACAARFVRRPMLRILISDTRVGSVARLMLLVCLGWLLLEALFIRLTPPALHPQLMMLLIVISSVGFAMNVLFLAVVAERKRARRKGRDRTLVQAMHRDPDTGLHNRHMAELYMQCFGPGTSVGMILLGVDHWPDIILRKGTETGERLQRHVSKGLGAELRPEEMMVLWEDGRFLVLSRALDAAGIKSRAEALRRAGELRGMLSDGLPELTLSAGAACSRRGDLSLEPAVSRAHAALHEAERTGCEPVVLSLVA